MSIRSLSGFVVNESNARVAKKNRKYFWQSAVVSERKEGLVDTLMSRGWVVNQENARGTLRHLCQVKQDITSTQFINRVERRYVPFTSGYTSARHRDNLLTVSSSMVTRMGLHQLTSCLPDSEWSSPLTHSKHPLFSTQCLQKCQEAPSFLEDVWSFFYQHFLKTIICNHPTLFRYCHLSCLLPSKNMEPIHLKMH